LTPGIHEFLEMLESYNIRPVILSEGFDFYINRILESNILGHLERITNTAVLKNNKLSAAFPHFEKGCRGCSNCKGYQIARLLPKHKSAIYIGDGHSDFHASRQADIVFAKSHLKDMLVAQNKPFIEYDDFFDVQQAVIFILERGIFARSNKIDLCFAGQRHFESLQRLWEFGDVMTFVGYPNGLNWDHGRYQAFWKNEASREDVIRLAIENPHGDFMGEAMIPFPDSAGFCQPDVKMLPEYQSKGLGREAWEIMLDRISSRWPKNQILVTPSVENVRAISLYLSLGFEFDGQPMVWTPMPEEAAAIPVTYRRMIKGQNEDCQWA
jgi:RimJ/RimL family protein N-acetyltransferase